MTDGSDRGSAGEDLAVAIRVLAVDPGIGLRLRGPADPQREAALATLRALLPTGTPWRVMPPTLPMVRLLDGLDVAATLAAGARRALPPFLAGMAGGLVILPGAERIESGLAAALSQALDRAGFLPPGLVLLDDARAPEETVPALLADRAGMDLTIETLRVPLPLPRGAEVRAIKAARARLPDVLCPDARLESLCGAALAVGLPGLRVPLLALRVAKAVAVLDGRSRVGAPDAEAAARLCLAPRALTALSDRGGAPSEAPHADSGAPQKKEGGDGEAGAGADASTIVAAARTALPDAWCDPSPHPGRNTTVPGRARGRGAAASPRGRTVATRPGRPDDQHPLDLPATLRAAMPWQGRRGRVANGPLRIRPDDLQVAIRRAPPHAMMVLAVDASGSAALGRLAEAKGAVELLLARSYVRRDSVALVSFGGQGAALLLPPTRALARAKRELADLPGGGGTPLAAGLDLVAATAIGARRGGSDVSVAVLTDGRANVARSGAGGRAGAEADAFDAAARIRAAQLTAVVIDTAPRPGPAARRLAEAMGARYLTLPRADANGIADALMPVAGRPF